MKKFKKMLLFLILATVACFTLAICSACEPNGQKQYQSVYEAYVAAMEDDGQEPLSYETWLDAVNDALESGATSGDAENTEWTIGATPPDNDSGSVGDTYLNASNFDAYVKTENGWENIGNLAPEKTEKPDSNTVTLTLDAAGGEIISEDGHTSSTEIKIEKGKTVELPWPYRPSYIFKGWYVGTDNATPVDKNTAFYENTTLTAKWSDNSGFFQEDFTWHTYLLNDVLCLSSSYLPTATTTDSYADMEYVLNVELGNIPRPDGYWRDSQKLFEDYGADLLSLDGYVQAANNLRNNLDKNRELYVWRVISIYAEVGVWVPDILLDEELTISEITDSYNIHSEEGFIALELFGNVAMFELIYYGAMYTSALFPETNSIDNHENFLLATEQFVNDFIEADVENKYQELSSAALKGITNKSLEEADALFKSYYNSTDTFFLNGLEISYEEQA